MWITNPLYIFFSASRTRTETFFRHSRTLYLWWQLPKYILYHSWLSNFSRPPHVEQMHFVWCIFGRQKSLVCQLATNFFSPDYFIIMFGRIRVYYSITLNYSSTNKELKQLFLLHPEFNHSGIFCPQMLSITRPDSITAQSRVFQITIMNFFPLDSLSHSRCITI